MKMASILWHAFAEKVLKGNFVKMRQTSVNPIHVCKLITALTWWQIIDANACQDFQVNGMDDFSTLSLDL